MNRNINFGCRVWAVNHNVGSPGLFFDTVLQTEIDPTPLASEGIQTGSVRALRSIMGETARRSQRQATGSR